MDYDFFYFPRMNGSSPRMWGKYNFCVINKPFSSSVHPHVCGVNVTPGCTVFSPLMVHPHVCGVNELVYDVSTNELHGSSPRMWGK